MGVLKNVLRNRIKSNAGGLRSMLFFQSLSDFTTVAKPLKFADITVTIFADLAARDASTPSSGDVCYVTSEDKNYQYQTSAWVEIEDNQVHDDHVLANGFAKLETTDLEERPLVITGPEEADSTGFEASVDFMIPGFDTKNINLFKELTLEQGIGLVKDRNGKVWQLGTEDDPARISLIDGSGTKGKATQAPGLMFKLSSDSGVVEYLGAIDTI